MRTGGAIGSGRWIIHKAADVRSATMDVIRPVRTRVLDYGQNPWHVIQWSDATPPGGMETELAVVDSKETLSRIPRGGLAGKLVLTRMDPRGMLRSFSEAGAAGVVADHPVPNLPDATAWTKFGWGGVPIQDAAIQMVGLVLSENQGKRLRRLMRKHGSLTVRTDVDIRHYQGTHDQVSGVVPGDADPQDEVWALAHSAEPGAIDNASGVALCLEIARVLEELIAAGELARPRRTIRLMSAYECHGFFKYLEDTQRLQTPLAGVVIDSVGSKPSVCGGRIEWHASIPMSAGFVDRLGETILTETLRLRNPGYRLSMEPFQPTSDTLIGDPKYGFPCPWLTTHHHKPGRGFDAYHSSADTPALLSTRGLAACATAMAGYLYWLADAGTDDIVDVAAAETARTMERLRAENLSVAQVEYEREQHRVILEKLHRWMWGGRRRDVLEQFAGHEREVRESAADAVRGKRRPHRRRVEGADRIPRRTRVLSPIGENTAPEIAGRISKTGLSPWALFWADGNRTIQEISQAVACETGNEVKLASVVAYFEAHAELGVRGANREIGTGDARGPCGGPPLAGPGPWHGRDGAQFPVVHRARGGRRGYGDSGAAGRDRKARHTDDALVSPPGGTGVQSDDDTHDQRRDPRCVLATSRRVQERPFHARGGGTGSQSRSLLQGSREERTVDAGQPHRPTRTRERSRTAAWRRPQCHDSLPRGRIIGALRDASTRSATSTASSRRTGACERSGGWRSGRRCVRCRRAS